MPSAAPYDLGRDQFALTPTYDGSGQAIHPGVLDFRQINGGTWRGWRYWMVMTPWPARDNSKENPSILVSRDGYTWHVPAGLTNPIRATTDGGWASDADIEYDASTDELVVIWRPVIEIPGRVIRSADGVTWYGDATCTLTYPVIEGATTDELLSPCIIRNDDGTWDIWVVAYAGDRNVWKYHTSNLLNWGTPTPSTGLTGKGLWHIDVTKAPDGRYLLVYNNSGTGIFAASSTDGLTWTANPQPLFSQLNYNRHQPYRSTCTIHENGQDVRVWISCATYSVYVWRTFYIRAPLSHWPTP